MGSIGSGGNRNNFGFAVMPFLAGILIGLAGFLVKIAMSKLTLSPIFLLDLLQNHLSYLAAAMGLAGFLLFQKSLYTGKISMVIPIINGLSILIPVALAFIFLAESASPMKIIGVVLIVIGIVGISK